MELFDFLALMVSAIILTLLFMVIGEKVISMTFRNNITPFFKIVGSLVFAIVILTALMYGLGKITGIYACLLSGTIILYNKYWLGHFLAEKEK
ncbi:MAG TPA: hypothetical protein K8V56_03985 [Sporosarcina psychrophila]|uniref:Uncharacterized protein n=1 Tax=Sporosarcina psychrophila TaxID=1476 RepID=A0A921KCG5_SPOPS|nr:hypothetical protein [Sporosarcina psychrophila]